MAPNESAAAATLTDIESSIDLAVHLYDHYESLGEVKHYYGVLAIYALVRAAKTTGDPVLVARCERILRRFPAEVEHPRYNFQIYAIGGLGQAYALAMGMMPDRADLVREHAEELMAAPRDAEGILTMPGEPGDKVWIDTAMAASPYLMYAGLALDEPAYLDEAVRQTVLMYDLLLDPDNGLLHQCMNFVGPGLLSEDHWSRGNGWGYFALAELVAELPAAHPGRPGIERRFRDLSEALLPHQAASGLWRQEIPLATSWEESSGSGLIVYGFAVGIRTGLLTGRRWQDAVDRGVAGLIRTSINADGSIENSCPGTLCPGDGVEKGTVRAYVELRAPYRDEPHGCAPLMLALTEAAMHEESA
ncbi:glycoside hydrolase family 88 protein [Microbacterium sp. ISL-59]|uniref:glycoside hydrolase family 88 protein n=1 Tax=Microbacterium sp. ISL-59 TaxID=2819159 RepID=UPI001BE83BA8|nr:glycoside hydrolase family 88 protein [Microbacterium sp. ISL-59]MBT2496683.1 glycoside hydrolase family 88 protein [Microbacterium sp. ISL-59]